jgi:hypothetical protein
VVCTWGKVGTCIHGLPGSSEAKKSEGWVRGSMGDEHGICAVSGPKIVGGTCVLIVDCG